MQRLRATDRAAHEAFARTGRSETLRDFLARYGGLCAALLADAGAPDPDAALTEALAGFLARRHRGPEAQWPLDLLRAVFDAVPRSTASEFGPRALALAGRAGLDLDAIAHVLRAPAEDVGTALSQTCRGLLPAERALGDGPFHLAPEVRIGLATATLSPGDLATASTHLLTCAACRAETEAVREVVASTVPARPETLPPALVERIVGAALSARLAHAAVPRALRFTGLTPGAPRRPLRLGIVGLLALMTLISGITWAWQAHLAAKSIETELVLLDAPELLAGASTAVSVRVRPVDTDENRDAAGLPGAARRDAPKSTEVRVVLRGPAGRELARGAVKTDAQGLAVVPLTLADLDEGQVSATLEAEADVDGERRRVTAPVNVVRRLRQVISADKPTYQPGQTVHLRGLSLDEGSGKPLAGRPARIELRDPRGNRIVDQQTTVSPHGVTAADVELSPGAALGRYTARLVLEGQNGTAETTLLVERYTLPPFSVAVKAGVPSTDGREPFDVDIDAKFTSGVPMARGMARLTVLADAQEVYVGTRRIEDGKARLTVRLPDWLVARTYRPPTTLVLHAAVRDPAGRAEEGRGGLELQGDALTVTLLSEAPSVRRALPRLNRLLVRTQRPDGTPVQAPVVLFSPGEGELETVGAGERLGEITTNADGLAFLDLPPAYFGRPLAVLATDPQDKKAYWTTMQPPPMREGALVLGCDKALVRAGRPLRCEVFVPSPRARIVRAELAGRVVAMAASPAAQGIYPVELALPASAPGLVRITMEDAPLEDAVHVLVAPHDGLRVEVGGLDGTREPGAEIGLRLKVTNAAGQPRAASVGLAVVDAAVFARVAGTTPKQIIARLFEQPGLAPVGMALLFAERTESGGATDAEPWSALQQTEARWLLASARAPAAAVRTGSSLPGDAMALSSRIWSARSSAQTALGLTLMAFTAALLLTFLVVSFWFRATFVAVCAALVTAVGLKFLLDDVLGMRSQTVDPVALLLGLFSFAGVVLLARARRGEIARGRVSSAGWINWAAPAAAVLVLLGLLTLSTRRYETSYAPSPTSVAPGYMAEKSEEGRMGGGDRGRFDNIAAATPAAPASEPMAPPAAEENRRFSIKGPAAGGALPKRTGGGFSESSADGLFGEAETGIAPAGLPRSRRAESSPKDAAPAEPLVSLRQEFPETLYFNPAVVVGEDGAGEVRFRAADSITTWEAYALASDAAGLLGAGSGRLVVHKPFHVDLDVPTDLTVGDDVTLQISVANDRDAPASARLTAVADRGLSLDVKPLEAPVALAAHGLAGRLVDLKAVAAGDLAVTLSGELAGVAGARDALKRPIAVSPNGREVKQTYAGLVVDTVSRTIDLPADAFADGKSVVLTLLGSPLAAALDGLHLLTRAPRGAFEQQLSTAYANALILQALRATGRIDQAQESQLLRFLRLSYQDVLGYESPGGGYSEFGGDAPIRTASTAYGLMVLSELGRFTYVDADAVTRARQSLLRAQIGDGGFAGPTETAFVALALATHDPACLSAEDPQKPWTPELRIAREACRKVFGRLIDAFSLVEGVDAYTLALAADALLAGGANQRARSRAEAILDELDRRAAVVGEGRHRRVSFLPRSATIYGARGRAAEVETTALVTHALVTHGGRQDKAREALRSLLVLRDDAGGFHSAHGTALALRALLAAARSGQAGGRARVLLDGTEVALVEFDPVNVNEPRRLDLLALAPDLRPGAALTLSVDGWDGAADLAYRLTTHHFEPWTRPPARPVAAPGDDAVWMALQQAMDAPSYGLGDRAELTVDVDRYGGRAANGLLIAQIGLPPGFRTAPDAFERGVIGPALRVEPAARGLTVYLEDPTHGRTTFTVPLIASRAVRRVVVPRSRVYFAYQPYIEAQAAPVPVFVKRLLGDRTGTDR
ncbi:MG2 domain-containing protein [Myxococcota bacterium]|nr:MG2 domain-containing protein [Myxococcota bacterium]